MKKFKQKRAGWFRAFKTVTRLKYNKCKLVYLGKRITAPSIILSNHEGASGPMMLENFADFPIRFWGTAEMNSGFRRLWRYQTQVYYHQKKGWNIHLARLFCLIASPLTFLFYKGLQLISTYTDNRLIQTIRESEKAIENGNSIVIFPEDSSKGYFEQMTHFYAGFALLAETLLRKGVDIEIYTAYFKKKEKEFRFDKPILYSELKKMGKDRYELAAVMLQRCNRLGALTREEIALLQEQNLAEEGKESLEAACNDEEIA